jgi:protein SCO1/2
LRLLYWRAHNSMTNTRPAFERLRKLRLLLWLAVAVAIVPGVMLALSRGNKDQAVPTVAAPQTANFGGPFTLVDGNGRAFSSQALAGKPYAIYFGFTRCGDTCPTTLQRLVKLRRAAASDGAMRILFITIDPRNDGPKEVGQYATLFGAPIVGLTGSARQIDQVKKQYGIHAEPVPHAAMGKEIEHTAAVLLFGRDGRFAGTISADDSDAIAIGKMKALVA